MRAAVLDSDIYVGHWLASKPKSDAGEQLVVAPPPVCG
jgi:hypothetical protein